MPDKKKSILLSKSDRGVVVFLVWKSLPYGVRMAMSLTLILVGLVLQFVTSLFVSSVIPITLAGVLPVAFGSLLLLVRGYDNRVDTSRLDPNAEWVAMERAKLAELMLLDQKMRKWDASFMDITNVRGVIAFTGVTLVLLFLAAVSPSPLDVIAVDAMILLLPNWFTGIKRVLRYPKLLVKIDMLSYILSMADKRTEEKKIDAMILLQGKEMRIPEDVKFRISFKGHDPDFLGLYGQVVTNDVQGKSFPYFYVVIVAKKSYGLRQAFEGFQRPPETVKEFETKDDVEFIVLRQQTTETSGYHTKPDMATMLFVHGYNLAYANAFKSRPAAPAP